MNSQKYYIATFYKFIHLQNLENIQKELEQKAQELNVSGLWILGPEGLNTTVSSPSANSLEQFIQWVKGHFKTGDMMVKNSVAERPPFRRFKVKIRDEIVTLGTPELFPDQLKNHHLTPTEWNKVLKEEKDFVLIDTRNWYETKIGTFKGAVNPMTDKFTEFPDFMEKQKIPKDKKLLIFCTGGIRCEKGILELQRQGYDNVYQLEGGILKYLEEYPNDQFEGECFVFDHRVAVQQDLTPTKIYDLCPHCGQPAATEIQCKRCDHETLICEDCKEKAWAQETCSKHCAYQLRLHPDRKGPRQENPLRR